MRPALLCLCDWILKLLCTSSQCKLVLLGCWDAGRLGDRETGKLGNWETGRPGLSVVVDAVAGTKTMQKRGTSTGLLRAPGLIKWDLDLIILKDGHDPKQSNQSTQVSKGCEAEKDLKAGPKVAEARGGEEPQVVAT